jgi:hypothetical protein
MGINQAVEIGLGGSMPEIQPYRVTAFNLARNSENKMHDDTVARRFGFTGGLVPGVDVFAYMSHMPVGEWGRAFLERGRMEGRFEKPVYDGEMVEVTAQRGPDGLSIRLASRGDVCANATASLLAAAPALRLEEFRNVPPVAERRPVDAASYAPGSWLGIPPYRQGATAHADYLRDIREGNPLYAREGLTHPGTLLRTMNWALMENAVLGPWIHVGSTLSLLGLASPEDQLTVRARVSGNYERKGHRFVELDGLIVANGDRPVAHCRHIAITVPRQVTA